jgi:hypothetical protein
MLNVGTWDECFVILITLFHH